MNTPNPARGAVRPLGLVLAVVWLAAGGATWHYFAGRGEVREQTQQMDMKLALLRSQTEQAPGATTATARVARYEEERAALRSDLQTRLYLMAGAWFLFVMLALSAVRGQRDEADAETA
jgi:hypothetical protein